MPWTIECLKDDSWHYFKTLSCNYFNSNFTSCKKDDIDLMMFSIFMESYGKYKYDQDCCAHSLEDYTRAPWSLISDYEIANKLGISVARASSLRERAWRRPDLLNESTRSKNDEPLVLFKRLLKQSSVELNNGVIKIPIPIKPERDILQGYFYELGMFGAETRFGSYGLSLDLKSLVNVLVVTSSLENMGIDPSINVFTKLKQMIGIAPKTSKHGALPEEVRSEIEAKLTENNCPDAVAFLRKIISGLDLPYLVQFVCGFI